MQTSYRQEQIDHIHNNKNDISGRSLVASVAEKDERRSDDVVSEHLPVIFSAFLDVDNKDLLQPESELSEIVPLVDSSHG